MKSWQAQGEVRDSDEEDLFPDLDFLESERPSKRIKREVRSSKAERISDAAGSHEILSEDELQTRSPAGLRSCQAAFSRFEHGFEQHPVSKREANLVRSSRDAFFEEASNSEENDALFRHHEDKGDNVESRPVSQDTSAGVRLLHDPEEFCSSPLSEREVSPPPGLFLDPTRRAGRGSGTLSDSEGIERSPLGAYDHDKESDANLNLFEGRRRSLRARKHKQLHPYLYDKAQYQQQCRERGIKPIRLKESFAQAWETQDTFLSDSSSSIDAGLNLTQDSQHGYSSLDNREIFFERLCHGQDDFGVHDETSDAGSAVSRLPESGRDHLAQQSNQLESANENLGMNLSPLSPPDTPVDPICNIALPENRKYGSGFRLPFGRLPTALPTPQLSSSTKSTRFEGKRKSSQQSNLPDPRMRERLPNQIRAQTDIYLSSDKSGSDTDPEKEEQRIRHQKKRMKGVLPASWLTLDLQAQRSKKARSRSSLPALSQRRHLGVARKITPAKVHTDAGDMILIASGTESEFESDLDGVPEPQTAIQSPLRSRQLLLNPGTTFTSQIVEEEPMENDWIEPMLTSSARLPRTKSKKRRQQLQILEAFRSVANERVGPKEKSMHVSNSTTQQQTRDRWNVKARTDPRLPPLLSIHDALECSSPHPSLPHFVRLALRQTRQQPDSGRHSPSCKIIRLATADDTTEAQSTLDAWREGSIRPQTDAHLANTSCNSTTRAPVHTTETRSPLSEVSANQTHTSASRTNGGLSLRHPRQRPRVQRHQLQRAHLSTSNTLVQKRTVLDHQNTKTRTLNRKSLRCQPRTLRKAQLETTEEDFVVQHRGISFEHRIQCLTEHIALSVHARRTPIISTSALTLRDHVQMFQPSVPEGNAKPRLMTIANDEEEVVSSHPIPHRSRKLRAHRLDVDTCHFRQPTDTLPDDWIVVEDRILPSDTSSVLQGLRPAGHSYPIDFDIRPLELGTFFHESTFIGSGDLKAALSTADRDLIHARGFAHIHLNEEVMTWSCWNEDVASDFQKIMNTIFTALANADSTAGRAVPSEQCETIRRQFDYLLRSVIRYCATCVYFADPIDRHSCAESLHQLALQLSDSLSPESASEVVRGFEISMLQYALVLAYQACKFYGVPGSNTADIEGSTKLVAHVASLLSKCSLTNGMPSIRSFYDLTRRSQQREAGILSDEMIISSVVLLKNVLEELNEPQISFWTIVSKGLYPKVGCFETANDIETVWRDTFTILPALEFDCTGIAQVGSRHTSSLENWNLIRELIGRVLRLYGPSSSLVGQSINDYIRTLFARCQCLLEKWGWWKCEAVLCTIYDFFANRRLRLLHKEENRGSPRFLDELEFRPALEIVSDDRSFHMLLKLLASGLLAMQKRGQQGEAKIGSLAWRFMPSHRRTYPKHLDLQQDDLNSLRNHCDLLCTLYYALPVACRFDVNVLRNLVDYSSSHREACRLGVKSWANITAYQASTTENIESLNPLLDWYDMMLKTSVAQYRLARSEAEMHPTEDLETSVFPQASRDRIIAKNQAQIAALLVDIIAGFKRAVRCSTSIEFVARMVERMSISTVLELFDPAQRRLLAVIHETLQLVDTTLDVQEKFRATIESQSESSDSQDFGDFSAIQELVASEHRSSPLSSSLAEPLLKPIGQLVSNIFGADTAADDVLLSKVIDVWLRLSIATSHSSGYSWSSLLDEYSGHGWNQLRDTRQKHKFTPYFMARITETAGFDDQVRQPVLIAWVVSLVQREATLKFQHILTSTLLNHWSQEPLLRNLPFHRDPRTYKFEVTMNDLRQRRLALLSSILSNMRERLDDVSLSSTERGTYQTKYAEVLRKMMHAMKSNYQDLQVCRDNDVAASDIEGAYVLFVQHVVSFLQQYSTKISRIDPFFTDSGAFPLPADDPTYVVGKLKGYAPKLRDPRTRSELVAFVYTVSERAAVDGQQKYLTKQLAIAMNGSLECCSSSWRPSLRTVLLLSIFPAYIENSLATDCSWIVSLPILQACVTSIEDLLYEVSTEDEISKTAATDIVTGVASAIYYQVTHVVSEDRLLCQSHVLRCISVMLSVAQACFSLICVTDGAYGNSSNKTLMAALRAQVLAIRAAITGVPSVTTYDVDELPISQVVCSWPETRAFAEQQLRQSNASWSLVDGRYMLRRGRNVRDIPVGLDQILDEQDRLFQAITAFDKAYSASFGVAVNSRQGVMIEVDSVVV